MSEKDTAWLIHEQAATIIQLASIVDRLYTLMSLGASGVDDETLEKMKDAAERVRKVT